MVTNILSVTQTINEIHRIADILALGFSGLILLIVLMGIHLAEISRELKKIRKLLTPIAVNNTHDDKKKGE